MDKLMTVAISSDAGSLAAIEAARERIAGRVRRTETTASAALTQRFGQPVFLKCEHRQLTGSFKLRGATNALLSLPPEVRRRGVVTVSTGNHGRALAHAAAAEGVRCVVCLSTLVPANKVAAISAAGAEPHVGGASQDDAQQEAEKLVAEQGLVLIPPFDDPNVIDGQGTLGLEIVEDVPDLELVVVPLSGGGLAAGVAAAVTGVRPRVRVIGVSMECGAAMHASLLAGHPVQVDEVPTLADALGGGIGLDNRYTFAMARGLLNDVVLLSEAEIAAAIRYAQAVEGETLEGAGAVAIGALLAGKAAPRGPVVAILSGGNIDPALHRRILAGADNVEERA
jgi:threonine dehydratase